MWILWIFVVLFIICTSFFVGIFAGVGNYIAASEEAPNKLYSDWEKVKQNKYFISYKQYVKDVIKKYQNTLK